MKPFGMQFLGRKQCVINALQTKSFLKLMSEQRSLEKVSQLQVKLGLQRSTA